MYTISLDQSLTSNTSLQLLHVVNGHDGSLLWHLEEQLARQQSEVVLDVYSAQFIPDIDEDGFVDVISAHTVSDLPGED